MLPDSSDWWFLVRPANVEGLRRLVVSDRATIGGERLVAWSPSLRGGLFQGIL